MSGGWPGTTSWDRPAVSFMAERPKRAARNADTFIRFSTFPPRALAQWHKWAFLNKEEAVAASDDEPAGIRLVPTWPPLLGQQGE